MGLGKTLMTISLLGYLHSVGAGGPTLVLVPKTTLANWQKEVARWCPSLRTLVFLGEREVREGIAATELQAGVAVAPYLHTQPQVDAPTRGAFRARVQESSPHTCYTMHFDSLHARPIRV